jgi:PAS domain S-box-containing protein
LIILQIKFIALAPLVAFILTMILAVLTGSKEIAIFEPPNLYFVLNIVFWSIALAVLLLVSVRSFMLFGSIIVVLTSASILILGLSIIVIGFVVSFSVNYAITIGAICYLVGAILQFAASIIAFKRRKAGRITERELVLVLSYLLTLVFVGFVFVLALSGMLPPFFTASGPTPLRLVITTSHALLFTLSSIIFGLTYLRSKSPTIYWYSLAIGAIAIGVFASLATQRVGDIATWVSRISFYTGTVYLIVAILKTRVSTADVYSRWAEAFGSDSRQINSLFANMLDAFAYCKIVTDDAGKPVDWIYLEVNNSFETITGLKREVVIGKKVTEVQPSERNDTANLIGKFGDVALACETTRFESYSESMNKWLDFSAFCSKKGYFIMIFADVTERDQGEKSIRKREQELSAFVQASSDAVYRMSPDWKEMHQLSGRNFLADTNEPSEIWLTKYIPIEDQPQVTTIIKKAIETKTIFELEHRVIRRDGSIGWTLSRAIPLLDDKDDITEWFGTAKDVTEQKEFETKMQEQQRLAAIGATAGMVGHDIRNPLQAITSDVYLAKTELASTLETDEKKNMLESLTEIEKNIDYINKIVQDLQDYARPLNPNPGEADLKLIIEKLLQKNDIPKNIAVSLQVEDEARKFVADADYLNRIFYNLIINAVQAMPKGGKLNIHVYKEANDVVITIKDTGVGIPKEIQEKMFTPMFTTKAKGQGFGLPVIKRMTEALGGTVSFESEEGKGTKFIIDLPLT